MSKSDEKKSSAADTDQEATIQLSGDEDFSGTAKLDPALLAQLQQSLAAQQGEPAPASQGAPPPPPPPSSPAPNEQPGASGDFEGTAAVDAALVEQLKDLVVPFKEAPAQAPPLSASSTGQRTAASALGRGDDQFGGTTKLDASLLTAHRAEDAAAPFRVQKSPESMRAEQRAAEERERAEEEARKADELARAAEQDAAEKAAQAELAARETAERNAEQRARYEREQAEAKVAEQKRQEEAKRRKMEQRKKERGSVFSTLGRKKK